MPWSEADRAKYDVIRERYSSDLSDAEFGLIFPLLPTRKRRRRRPTCAREILNALFYLIRSGTLRRASVRFGVPEIVGQLIAQSRFRRAPIGVFEA